jgi:hypothetical protein
LHFLTNYYLNMMWWQFAFSVYYGSIIFRAQGAVNNMQELTRTITEFPGGDKSFVEVPFEVGPEIERIEVSYRFPAGSGGSVIDIGMAHNGIMRGWTGSEYSHITIAEDWASPGYHAGSLEGRWDVVLGIYTVGPNCKVDVSIRLIERKERWLTGDIHSHTAHSDGSVPVADAIHRARNSRLDFVALTDHNTTVQNTIRLDEPGMLVIPGMELTTYYGHTIFLGLADPVEDWRCSSPEDVAMKMAEAKEKGATVVINHPFQRSPGGRWQSGFDVAFDALEIWNGHWSDLNRDGLAFWQELLVSGRRIPATGGSDFHLKNRRRHGRPSNHLNAKMSSIGGILSAIRAGRNVVMAAPDEASAEPTGNDAPMFGDVIEAGMLVGVKFTGLCADGEIRVVNEKGVVETHFANAATLEVEHKLNGRFLRFEVWNGENPCLFTNPFYAG